MATMKLKKICKSNASQIAAIFFDLDNTLISTRKGDSRACSKLCDVLEQQYALTHEQAGQITATFLKAFRRCPDNPNIQLDEWRQYLWSEALPESHKHHANDIYQMWIELRYRYLMLTAEIVALLQSLRQCYQLAIITNGPSNAQWEKLQRLNLIKMFDCILVSGDLPWEKPSPNIFYAACKYLSVQPENCVMIGDKIETDIQGGIDAKLGASIWMPLNGGGGGNDVGIDGDDHLATNTMVTPDYVIQNLNEILPILQHIDRSSAAASTTTMMADGRKAGGSNGSTGLRRKGSISGGIRRSPYNRRLEVFGPDLESGNSNSSDGS